MLETKRANVKLDGRDFAMIDQTITAAQNDYIQGQLALAGVNDLLVAAAGKPPEDVLSAYRREFITKILLSGRKANILAGCLVEVGNKWTRAEADRNAARFDDITDPAEIQAMTNSLASIVISFFQSAETFSKTSPRSSNPSDADHGTENGAQEISGSLQ